MTSKEMSDEIDRLSRLLNPFGIKKEAIHIYLLLSTKRELSALEISRHTGISRTKVYGLLDKLQTLGLVALGGKPNAKRFRANSYKNLETIVNRQRRKLEILESSLPSIYKHFAELEGIKDSNSKIIKYEGIDGLRSVLWNSTKAIDELRVLEFSNDMSAFLDFDFAERVRIEFVRNKLKRSLQITNYKKIAPWTNIEEFVSIWEPRYVNPKKVSINSEITIYNDVVAIYEFKNDQLFCIEIYNQGLADTQRMLFDMIWETSIPMQKTGNRGEAKVANR